MNKARTVNRAYILIGKGFVMAHRFVSHQHANPSNSHSINTLPFTLAILLGVSLNAVNSSTISIAIPDILRQFHLTPHAIVWIISGFYLGSAITQPIAGDLGDILGYKRLVYLGLGLLLITALGAPFAPFYGILVLWRVIQAVSTSILYPNAIGLVRLYQSEKQGQFLGWIGMSIGISAAIGPTVGGFLVKTFDWRAIFWLNAPLVILTAALLWMGLRYVKPTSRGSLHALTHFDAAGTLLFVVTMVLWLIWSNSIKNSTDWLYLLAAIFFTILFIIVENHSMHPVIPVKLFRSQSFSLYSALTVTLNVVFYAGLFGIPTFLQDYRHWSVVDTALALFAMSAAMAVGSIWGGRFAQGSHRRLPLLWGTSIALLGSFFLVDLDQISIFMLLSGVILLGFGYAINNVVLQKAVIESVPAAHTGTIAGTYMLLRYLGAIVSAATLSVMLGTLSTSKTLFVILSLLSVLAVAGSFFTPLSQTHQDG
ncbi:MFS transporter [Sulfobacillus thermosulfidooxidans]|uniref:MFS transporter n=1 Tax=Sulfobacillus thermosulfidooxidans TaxID=28034 RepID=UPI001493FD67|nr:MFS transporter [Sulfobacillus thermosulfidooxidans]